jgi:hypothetical protein
MTGPQDPAAAGRDRLRAGHADREQVIEALKNAFVHGRLTKNELDTRAGQALAARTYADLAALTTDIPAEPVAVQAASPRPPAPARRRPLVRAAAGSGGCLVVAFAAMQVAQRADPGNTPGTLPGSLALPSFLAANAAVFVAVFIMIYGVVIAVAQRRSRRQLPPRPGPGGPALDGERHGGADHDRVPPGLRTDRGRADLRSDNSRPPSIGRGSYVSRSSTGVTRRPARRAIEAKVAASYSAAAC